VLLFCTVADYTVRNVARLRPTLQVSTHRDEYGQHHARYANDGILQTNYSVYLGGCAGSEPATNPWWSVELGGPTLVFMVKLTNRGDAKGTVLVKVIIIIRRKRRRRMPCYRKDDRAMRPICKLFTRILFTLTATVLCADFDSERI